MEMESVSESIFSVGNREYEFKSIVYKAVPVRKAFSTLLGFCRT